MSDGRFDPLNPTRLLEDDGEEKQTEEEALLEQDIERSTRRNKKGVKLGAESDSSDEDKGNEDDDDDMFASENEEDDEKKKSKSKGTVHFLNLDQVTEDNDDNNDGVSDNDEQEEVTESNVDINYFVNPDADGSIANGGSLKSSTRREPKVESFGLQSDLEEGKFDEQGNFIRNAQDAAAHQDQWLQDYTKKDIIRARAAHQNRIDKEKEGMEEVVEKTDILGKLIETLEVGESLLEALQRLNKKKKKQEEDVERKSTIELITDCAEQLMQLGVADVYEKTREELSRDYTRETGQNYVERKRKRSPSPENNTTNRQENWEFKWGLDEEETHGPYSTQDILAWIDHGYFDENVYIKKYQTEDDQFIPIHEANF